MYYHLDIEQQLQRIMNKINFKDLSENKPHQTNEDMYDICDGAYYKSILERENSLKNREAFTFLLNTDGASFCKKSKLTIWPVYLVINEHQSRYSFENVILAGLSVGDCKPNFESFLNPIIMQLKKLEYGISISFADAIIDIKFFLTHAVMDKPAKAAVIKMISSTGFFGCTKCTQAGKSLRKNLSGE